MAQAAETGRKMGRTSVSPILIPVGMIAFFILYQFGISRITEPELHAERTSCIGSVDGDPPWRNGCEETVNFRYCLLAGDGRETCRALKLAPGEGVHDTVERLAELGGGFVNMRRMACTEPFSVMRKPHPNNGRLRDVCG